MIQIIHFVQTLVFLCEVLKSENNNEYCISRSLFEWTFIFAYRIQWPFPHEVLLCGRRRKDVLHWDPTLRALEGKAACDRSLISHSYMEIETSSFWKW